jgi:hypothetical protein
MGMIATKRKLVVSSQQREIPNVPHIDWELDLKHPSNPDISVLNYDFC